MNRARQPTDVPRLIEPFLRRGEQLYHTARCVIGRGIECSDKGTVAEMAKMLRKSRYLPVPETFQKTC